MPIDALSLLAIAKFLLYYSTSTQVGCTYFS